ncbi:zona pellucida sperm-binding protein 3-like [Ictalurus furcatus]|uniref:zona pellucida sperm-binding protein 3-like n=1 Tax=Ictalurus furcatus TaxID=66913 RepID=UPI0023508DD2|nr:zona pellucida sperm-binding protein 3-like [Ictalurus furcatus]
MVKTVETSIYCRSTTLQLDPFPTLSVTAECNETAVYVAVKKNLFGNGKPINMVALTLGGCAAKGENAASQVLIYESGLDGCNSKLAVNEDELVYVFALGFASEPLSGTPISTECHYPRFRDAPSSTLMPAWISHDSTQAAEEPFVFSLRLMMDDWISERPSNQYNLAELINIDASVLPFSSVPLHVLVGSCMATAVPDINTVPRYSFIENYGCLVDSKTIASNSHFIPQTGAAKHRFQMEAFRFQQGNGSLVYITCTLKATAVSAPPDAEHKACSFSGNRWTAAYGADQVCSCCNSHCSLRKGQDQLCRV